MCFDCSLVQWRSLLCNTQGREAKKRKEPVEEKLWHAGADAVGGLPVFGSLTLHMSLTTYPNTLYDPYSSIEFRSVCAHFSWTNVSQAA